MDEEDRNALIEEVASAWRPSDEDGLSAHPAWEELDEAGRLEAHEIAASLRMMEAALDSEGLSTTGRTVLERIQGQKAVDATLERGAQVIPFPKRILQTQPLAVAAIALLVVGIGVWAVPGLIDREGEPPGAGRRDRERVAAVEEPEQPREAIEPVPDPGEQLEVREELAATKTERRRRRPQPKASKDQAPVVAAKESSPERKPRAAEPADDLPKQPHQPELEAFAKRSRTDPGSAKAISGSEQASGATEQERKICQARVSVVEKLISKNENYEPVPQEQLALGRCYRVLGNDAKAREWLRRAVMHPETKARAEKALRELGND